MQEAIAYLRRVKMQISKFSIENADDKILSYEDVIGAKLPEQLTIFIKKYNGGETPNTNFATEKVSSDIKGFYGIGNVKYSFDRIKAIEIGGEKYLPIAFDSFGNDIVTNLSTGEICFHDHENGKLTMLSKDMRSFFSICESKPVSKGAVKTVEQREKELIDKGRGSIITEALRDMWRAEIAKYSSMNCEEVVI